MQLSIKTITRIVNLSLVFLFLATPLVFNVAVSRSKAIVAEQQ